MSSTNAKVQRAASYWAGRTERRSLAPHELKRRPWAPGQRFRQVLVEARTESPTAKVWLEDRSHHGLVFTLEIDQGGQLVGFGVRPLAFVGVYTPEGEPLVLGAEIDHQGVPEGAPRVTATLMRQVPLGELHAAAVASLETLRMVGTEPPADRKRYRSDAVSDAEVARFVELYLNLVADGSSSSPLRATAGRFGLSYDGARERLRTGRQRGLYVGLGRGRAGGHLTPKGVAALRSE